MTTGVGAEPLRSKYQILRWEPGREVRVHKPRERLGALAWTPAATFLTVFGMAYLALSMLAGDMAAANRLLISAGAAGTLGVLALIGIGIAWTVAWASGPRTVVLDWPERRLSEQVRDVRNDHDFSSLRELELRRTKVTGENGPPSYSCALYASVARTDGATRSIRILDTDLIDNPDSPYAMTAGLASQLAESLGLALQVTERHF